MVLENYARASVEKVNMAAKRAIEAARAGKAVRLFCISDWDRYGWTIVAAVARKLEYRLDSRLEGAYHSCHDQRGTKITLLRVDMGNPG